MRKSRNLETGRDRKALARDAGLGRISVVSILAGTFSAYGALAALLALVGLVAVAVNGGQDFSNVSGTRFMDASALIMVAATFLAFVFGGYTAGRMSRRSGATNGVAAGIVGVILAVATVVVVRVGGGGASLARVAVHINAPSTWAEWRTAGLTAAAVSVAAMVLGGLIGGASGERWHTKLLARAADASYGPEAERLAESQRLAAEAETAHVAAQERVTRATAVSSLPGRPTVVEPVSRSAARDGAPATAADQVRADRVRTAADSRTAAEADAAAADSRTAAEADAAAAADSKPRRRHLLHH